VQTGGVFSAFYATTIGSPAPSDWHQLGTSKAGAFANTLYQAGLFSAATNATLGARNTATLKHYSMTSSTLIGLTIIPVSLPPLFSRTPVTGSLTPTDNAADSGQLKAHHGRWRKRGVPMPLSQGPDAAFAGFILQRAALAQRGGDFQAVL
jgi:hypothetical protein